MPVVYWNPGPLLALPARAFRPAALATKAATMAGSPSKSAGARVTFTGPSSAILKVTGKGAIFEKGAKPHAIEPKKRQAMKFKDGGFAKRVDHPGSAPKPYLRKGAEKFRALYIQSLISKGRGIFK